MGMKRAAGVGEGAIGAVGSLGCALQCAEIHDGLVVGSRLVPGQQFLRQERKFFLSFGGIDGGVDAEMAAEHAIHISIHHGGRKVEGDGADGCCCVIAHAFQLLDAGYGVRKFAHRHDLAGGGMEVASAAVVAQPLPQAQHFVFACGGERCHIRKSLHHTMPIVASLLNARLLQNHFAQPDGVGVGSVAPRQITPMGGIPAEQGGGKWMCHIFKAFRAPLWWRANCR